MYQLCHNVLQEEQSLYGFPSIPQSIPSNNLQINVSVIRINLQNKFVNRNQEFFKDCHCIFEWVNVINC